MNNSALQKRTTIVLILTLITMVAEIYFGILFNSMGLTADGFHMGTHAIAFLITLIVCLFVNIHSENEEKINAAGGFASAIFLGITAIGIIYESFVRFFHPLEISFLEAIIVAVIGLIVNFICILIMGGENHFHHHEHHEEEHENLNYKAAYMHIAADLFTSILAITGLLLGKYMGWVVLDPAIGVLGGLIIAKWTFDLIKSSSKILFSEK